MSPLLEAMRLYHRWHQPRDFWEDYGLHRVTGYVIEEPDAFLMGRPVDRWADEEAVACPHVSFPASRQNAWFIWAYAGPLPRVKELAPYWLPWVGWSRRNGPIRWYPAGLAATIVDRHAKETRQIQEA